MAGAALTLPGAQQGILNGGLAGSVPGLTSGAGGGGPTVVLGDSTANPNAQLQAPAPSYVVGVNDPNTLAAYQQSIAQTNSALSNLPAQQTVGNQNIQNAYNTAFNQLMQSNANATQTYNQNKTTEGQNYVTAKNTIGQNAGSTLNGVERLLGSRGAGGSSAALLAAPQAVALQATNARGGAGQNYAQNEQGLDQAYGTYQLGVGQNKQDLANQLSNNQNSLASSIASNKAQLLNSLASLSGQYAAATGANPTNAAQPYLDQANQSLQAATQLGSQVPVYQTNPLTYTAPTLGSYTTNPFAAPVANNPSNNVVNSTVAPAFAQLLKPNLSGVSAA